MPEPAPDLHTLADLPFHVLGRHPKAAADRPLPRTARSSGSPRRDWFDRRARSVARTRRSWASDAATGGDHVREPARVADDRPGDPGRRRGHRAGLSRRSRRRRRATSCRTPARAWRSSPPPSSSRSFSASATSCRRSRPSSSMTMRRSTRPRPPSVSTLATSKARGHARMMGEWGTGREFRDRAQTVRPERSRDDHLHVGHDRRAERRDALARATSSRTCLPARSSLASARTTCALSFLPLSHSFERLVSYVYLANGVTIVFAESIDTIARDIADRQADGHDRRAARLREVPGADPASGQALPEPRRTLFTWGAQASAVRAAAPMAGTAARSSGHSRSRRQLADRARVRRRFARASAAGCGSSCPAARRCRPSVAEFFYGIGLPITEGYGLTETSPVLTVNPHGRAAARDGRQGDPRRRAADRRGRRDPGARPERDERLLQQARGDRRRAARRLVPHRRHRHARRRRAI